MGRLAVHQVLGDGGKEPGLEGVLPSSAVPGLRHDVMARVVWVEGTGQVLGTKEGEAVSYREDLPSHCAGGRRRPFCEPLWLS